MELESSFKDRKQLQLKFGTRLDIQTLLFGLQSRFVLFLKASLMERTELAEGRQLATLHTKKADVFA